jgi:hypothetical protein
MNENKCQAVENYWLCADILGIFSAQIHRQDFHALEELLLQGQTRGLSCLQPGIHRRCLYLSPQRVDGPFETSGMRCFILFLFFSFLFEALEGQRLQRKRRKNKREKSTLDLHIGSSLM